MTDCSSVRPSHPTFLDDEIAALALQLEELDAFSQSGKGKHAVDRPPDSDVAYASFQAELENHRVFLADIQLAQSMGSAVHTDGALITSITSEEVQAQEDRQVAIQISTNDPEISSPPRLVQNELKTVVQDWMSSMSGGNLVADYFSDHETEAGPSLTFAERQANALGRLSQLFQCTACTSQVPIARMVTAKCSHRYCADCMKSLFMRSTKDESLFPPKCCRQPVPLSTISPHMSADELATFESKFEELSTDDRVYCSNRSCNSFIPPSQIMNGTHRAVCSICAQSTCSICKNAFHKNSDCPDDPEIRQTMELAQGEGWQTCPRCKRLVELNTGCYHITCRCRAQFCYLCARKWKSCNCVTADEHRIEERAEEIVRRDAERVPFELGYVERQRRVREVHEELMENHECEHSRRFQRIFNPGRRGFRCEMCDDRHWKYILQCRHCYINVCEECRRNRI